MFSGFNSARTNGRKRSASSIAMALALATGTAVAVAGFASPAYAQKKPKAPKVEYSKPFVAAYEPVAKAFEAVAEGGDYAAIKAQFPGVVSAIGNEDDRYAAGQFGLTLGNKAKDTALQQQGLELMLASGKVAPEQIGQFQFFVGNLAYQAKDYAKARTALEAALAAGYVDDQAQALVMESYFGSGATNEGLAYLSKVVADRQAAGTAVPESWVVRGLAMAYKAKAAAQTNDLAALLVSTNPTPANWQASLQVVREVNQWSPEEVVDLGRLMMISGGMKADYDLAEYLEAADPRKLPNEVISALDAATAAGVIPANAPRFAEFRQIAQERAAADRADAAKAAGQAQATGTAALGTGDLLLSVGNYAAAEAMYQQAIDKGGVDANRALTRKGIAQVRQGKTAEAKATFAQVQGTRVPLAKMWAIYAAAPATAAGG
jgi:tetratricopeptide (TPR) repeat protein